MGYWIMQHWQCRWSTDGRLRIIYKQWFWCSLLVADMISSQYYECEEDNNSRRKYNRQVCWEGGDEISWRRKNLVLHFCASVCLKIVIFSAHITVCILLRQRLDIQRLRYSKTWFFGVDNSWKIMNKWQYRSFD